MGRDCIDIVRESAVMLSVGTRTICLIVSGCAGDVRLGGEVRTQEAPLPRCPKGSNIGRVGLPGAVLRTRRGGTSGADGNRGVAPGCAP